MKVPPNCDLPVYSEQADMTGFFRSFTRRLKSILEELAQAVNANDARASLSASSGDGAVKMAGAGDGENTGWIEIEENKWIPYWSNPNP
ncbi:hypothetical protein SAMN02745216_04895 [Desulfatibacillum alkenivorans DSM 16219]|jgi:hypothetical protein|uniref:Uncharacterized protein n=1 Tax=Desulfatibacillum alkenivorans DSM 16219 TaxID=1121393 RepID=A0A1M6Z3Y6_9BACT|nr:hypothetical protein [Desulfatibacillum alkenivorans]SHL25246.1 hypothetical protein SAMN02745216_04895 [Desulfatibacillum alkenivorans DSM 16219]